MSYEYSRACKRRQARKRRAEEASWRALAGPVIVIPGVPGEHPVVVRRLGGGVGDLPDRPGAASADAVGPPGEPA